MDTVFKKARTQAIFPTISRLWGVLGFLGVKFLKHWVSKGSNLTPAPTLPIIHFQKHLNNTFFQKIAIQAQPQFAPCPGPSFAHNRQSSQTGPKAALSVFPPMIEQIIHKQILP